MAEREGSLTKAVNLDIGINLRRGSMNRVRDELASFEKLTAQIADKLAKKYKHLAPQIAKALRDEGLAQERFQARSIASRERAEQKAMYRRQKMYEKTLREVHKFELSDDARHQRLMTDNLRAAEKTRMDVRKARLLEGRRVAREALRQEQADLRSHMAALRHMERQNLRANAAANNAMRGDERGARAQRGLQAGWDRLGAQGERAYAGPAGGGRRGGGFMRGRGRGSMGGFIGLPGGLGGMYMAGPVGAAASIATVAGAGLYQAGAGAAEGYRSSDMAMRRMYSYVGSGERSRGNTFPQMRARTESLALGSGISVTSAAEAMQEALTNMISPENAQSFAEMAQSLALMENVDLKETVKGLAAIKNAFDLTEDEMMQVPDILAAAMQEGNVKIEGLSGVIGQTAQVAADAGKSGLQGLKDLSAGIAAFTLRGVPGEVASTSMRSVYMNIKSPSTSARKVQEEIGYTATPAAVRAHSEGVVGVLIELEKAAKAKGRTMYEAFSGEARTQKILPLLTKQGGKAVQEAKGFQQQALTEGRMKKILAELMGSPQKKMSVTETRAEIAKNRIGQNMDPVFQVMASEWADFLEILSGQRSFLGITPGGAAPAPDDRALAMDKARREQATNWKMDMSPLREAIAQQEGQKERDLELGRMRFHQLQNDVNSTSKEIEKLYNKVMPSFNKAMSIAASGMDKWGKRIVDLGELKSGSAVAASDRMSALDAAAGDFGGVAPMLGLIDQESRLGARAHAGANVSERVAALQQKQDATMGFAGMDIAGIAERGFSDKDLDAYIESQITSKRMRGVEASRFRKDTRAKARAFEKEAQAGLSAFQRAGGGDSAAFAADFTRQRLAGGEEEIAGQIKTGMEKANVSYDAAKADYEKYAEKVHMLETSWNSVAARMAEAVDTTKELNTQMDILNAKSTMGLILDSLTKIRMNAGREVPSDVLKSNAEGLSPVQNQSDIDIQNIHDKLGIQNESSFVGPGSSNGVAKMGGTVYNQQKYNIAVTVPEGTMDPEAVAQAVADKLRTNQERGRVTLTPAA